MRHPSKERHNLLKKVESSQYFNKTRFSSLLVLVSLHENPSVWLNNKHCHFKVNILNWLWLQTQLFLLFCHYTNFVLFVFCIHCGFSSFGFPGERDKEKWLWTLQPTNMNGSKNFCTQHVNLRAFFLFLLWEN